LRELPDELFELTSLEELYLAKNNLEFVPEGFRKLKNLSKLDLSFNKLSNTPFPKGMELDDFPKLEILNLQGNADLKPIEIPYKLRCLSDRYPIAHDKEFRRKLIKRNLESRKRVAAQLLDIQIRESQTPGVVSAVNAFSQIDTKTTRGVSPESSKNSSKRQQKS
jgi:Leucine-rich repeat (LRR) protein